MPNHVTNKIRISADMGLEDLKKLISGDNGEIDFNTIIPESEECTKSLDWKPGDSPEQDMTWYDEHCTRWGTKWNAYDINVENEWDGGDCSEMEIHFDTAWAPPHPVIKKLNETKGIAVWGHYVEEFAESAGVF
jgi:hypothetical protein